MPTPAQWLASSSLTRFRSLRRRAICSSPTAMYVSSRRSASATNSPCLSRRDFTKATSAFFGRRPSICSSKIRSSEGSPSAMPYGIRLLVSGDHACFTRPEMKVERVSYDVMTPSAARGILEAIHWKPAIRWIVEAIHVLKPIRFQSIRRNEVAHKMPAGAIRKAMNAGSLEGLALTVEDERQQRASTVLVDVDYVIGARFELTEKAGPDDNAGKHL